MARELTNAELLKGLVDMRERMSSKHGEDSEQVDLIDEAITDIVTGD